MSQSSIFECRQDQVEQIAKKLSGPLLVQKGAKDGISDGNQTIYCEGNGSKRRAGGQVRFDETLSLDVTGTLHTPWTDIQPLP